MANKDLLVFLARRERRVAGEAMRKIAAIAAASISLKHTAAALARNPCHRPSTTHRFERHISPDGCRILHALS